MSLHILCGNSSILLKQKYIYGLLFYMRDYYLLLYLPTTTILTIYYIFYMFYEILIIEFLISSYP
jgi:hypothetical protein